MEKLILSAGGVCSDISFSAKGRPSQLDCILGSLWADWTSTAVHQHHIHYMLFVAKQGAVIVQKKRLFVCFFYLITDFHYSMCNYLGEKKS